MNTFLVESPPPLSFHKISIDQDNWRERFFELIREKKPIAYDVDDMPNLTDEITRALDKNDYRHLVLKSNHDSHFFIPGILHQTPK